MFIDGWSDLKIKKKNVVYTYNLIIPLKRRKILMFATVWMNPKGFMLSEISTSEKDKIE